MKIAIFLIGVCLFLMGGVDRVFAGEHSKSCCYTRTYLREVLQEGKSGAYSTSGSGKQASFSKEIGYVFPDGLEEDDTEERFAQKLRSAVKYHSLLSYQSILNYLHHRGENAPAFGGIVSDKYIVQRVLRV